MKRSAALASRRRFRESLAAEDPDHAESSEALKTMKSTAARFSVSEQIVAFVDLVGYHRICQRLSPAGTFEFLAEYYSIAERALAGSDGRCLKFVGDAMLVVFPAEHAPEAVAALRQLKADMDAWLARAGHGSRVRVKAHVGEVAAGSLGGGEAGGFDVCGTAVNEAALLSGGDWVLSEALRRRIRV